jgi:hypothetical protein
VSKAGQSLSDVHADPQTPVMLPGSPMHTSGAEHDGEQDMGWPVEPMVVPFGLSTLSLPPDVPSRLPTPLSPDSPVTVLPQPAIRRAAPTKMTILTSARFIPNPSPQG